MLISHYKKYAISTAEWVWLPKKTRSEYMQWSVIWEMEKMYYMKHTKGTVQSTYAMKSVGLMQKKVIIVL